MKKKKEPRYEKDFTIPMPGMANLRSMKTGETRIFSVGHRKSNGQLTGGPQACSIASRIGMQIVQRTMILVDPVTYRSQPVVVVECIGEAAVATKPRGRKKIVK